MFDCPICFSPRFTRMLFIYFVTPNFPLRRTFAAVRKLHARCCIFQQTSLQAKAAVQSLQQVFGNERVTTAGLSQNPIEWLRLSAFFSSWVASERRTFGSLFLSNTTGRRRSIFRHFISNAVGGSSLWPFQKSKLSITLQSLLRKQSISNYCQ